MIDLALRYTITWETDERDVTLTISQSRGDTDITGRLDELATFAANIIKSATRAHAEAGL